MDCQENLDMSNFKDPQCKFAVEVSRIKYNATRATVQLNEQLAAKKP